MAPLTQALRFARLKAIVENLVGNIDHAIGVLRLRLGECSPVMVGVGLWSSVGSRVMGDNHQGGDTG